MQKEMQILNFWLHSDKEPAFNEEIRVGSLSQEDFLEKEMATSILALRIPWTEETGRLQSMGLERVRHE